MGIQDTTRLLQGMGRAYPSGIRIDELSRHTGLDGERAMRALRGLFEGGLITANGFALVSAVPGAELRLTEPGMAVAFGLACVEGDSRGAIKALEERTLSQLHRHRERKMSEGKGLVTGAPAVASSVSGQTVGSLMDRLTVR